jgi:hypothetical protein
MNGERKASGKGCDKIFPAFGKALVEVDGVKTLAQASHGIDPAA